MIVGDFYTPLTSMDRSSRQKTTGKSDLKWHTLPKGSHWYLQNITAAKYTFFSKERKSFSKIENMVGHKPSLKKFKTTEIISSMSSDHNGLKLEISNKEKIKNIKKHGGWMTCY